MGVVIRPRDVLPTLVDGSGMSRVEVSRTLGKSDRYISNRINSNDSPTITTAVSVANVCGFTMKLVRDNEEYIVSPEKEV